MAPNTELSNAVTGGGSGLSGDLTKGAKLSLSDVARHNNKEDCWLIIEGKVYDATKFLDRHPGGDVLVSWAGADASNAFEVFHTPTTQPILNKLYVGDLAESTASPVDVDYAALREELRAEGIFEASTLYYTWKCLSTTALGLFAVWFMSAYGSSLAGVIAGSFFLALFWQQCGWLSHDYMHYQVFANRKHANWMGIFLGNFYQGFDITWWKLKHNLHHAIPNVMEGVRDGDPDIATMPFLAWANDFIEHGELAVPPRFLKYQAFYFFPLLCVARMSWLLQSALTAASDAKKSPYFKLQILGLAAHYAYYVGIGYGFVDPSYRWLYFFLTQAFGGLLLGIVFTIGHNGMAVLPSNAIDNTDFFTMQVLTTRNVTPSLFNDWFTGGLNYQVEHHLFPTIPRHNFHKVAPRVKALCAKHNIPYSCTDAIEGMTEVVQCLRDIGATAAKQEVVVREALATAKND